MGTALFLIPVIVQSNLLSILTILVNTTIFFTLLGGIIPIAIGLIKYKMLTPVKLLIWTLMICSVALNIIQLILGAYHIRSLFIGHIYTLIEFVFIVYIYKTMLNKLIPNAVFTIILIAFVFFSLLNAFFIQGWQANNSYQRTIESVLVVGFALLYFYNTTRELKVKQIERESMFWLSVGVLLYFSGALFIFIFSNYLLHYSRSLALTFWVAHAFFLILFYISAAIALWINPKK